MKRILNFIINNKLYFLTFFISTIIITVLYIMNQVSPFGKFSLLCVDFYHQYGPMLAEFYDRIRSGESLIYSFNVGLGIPIFRNFLNYLSSPFNIIMFLFPRKFLITSYSFIIGTKASLASVSFVYYLSKKFDNKNIYLIILGILYAFSAYFSAYYWNIMWLDGLVFLPLITLGIENIINKNKWIFYTIVLAIMLIANYFIGYMLCIYSVIYFLIYLIYKTKLSKKSIKQDIKLFFKRVGIFGVSSLLAGCLVAFLLLPMAISLKSISATGGSIPTSQYYDFKPIDYLVSHLSGTANTTFASDPITPPNVSCGILSIALLVLFLINPKIKIKVKICYALLIGFFIFAFFNPVLDYVLHAFHVPNDLPYRYSFLYVFSLLLIGSYSLINLKHIKFFVIAIVYIILMGLLLVISKFDFVGILPNMVYINMIILSLYFMFYFGYYYLKQVKYLFVFALIVTAGIDVVVSIDNNWSIDQNLKGFYEDYNKKQELLDYAKSDSKDLFYRIENVSMKTLNDGSWYDYYGFNTFSSMAYESMASLQHKLGLPGNVINSYYYVQTTPIIDMMFNIKYFIGNSNDNDRYTSLYNNEYNLTEFDYNIGLMYGTNKEIEDWDYNELNPFRVQNDFIKKATGVKDVLVKADINSAEKIRDDNGKTLIKYTFKNVYDNFYYYSNDSSIDFFLIGECLYYNNDSYNDIDKEKDGISYTYLDKYDEERVINIHSNDEYIVMYVQYSNYYNDSFSMYYIDQFAFQNAYTILNNNKVDLVKFKESYIEGNVVLDSDNMLIYTSIPFDSGWHIKVNDMEVEPIKIGDSLLAFKGEKGKNNIKLTYKPPYMLESSLISILSLIIIIISANYSKIKKGFKVKKH